MYLKLSILWLFMITMSHCQSSTASEMPTEQDPFELILEVELTFAMSHGWGHVYGGKIQQVIKGSLPDSSIHLHITLADYDSLSQQGLPLMGKQQLVIASFNPIENDKPYVNFKNAFVDEQKRTWLLAQLKKKHESPST